MRVCLAFRQDVRHGPVECYARSVYEALQSFHYDTTLVGEGHDVSSIYDLNEDDYDFLLEIENGRNKGGELPFQQPIGCWEIPSAIWLIDSHGQSDLHKAISVYYNHVFFAVWSRRDLYAEHPSAHWAPCATDLKWFRWRNHVDVEKKFDFGFFGSKGGLSRADPLKEICEKNEWPYDIRQVTKGRRHKWPQCAEAMAACRNLFNHGQKHDGPNQRVMESMAMRIPLLSASTDPRDGMDKLFVEGYHYVGYESYKYSDLEEKCKWIVDNPQQAKIIAEHGFKEVQKNHTISARVIQILETVEK